MTSAMEALVAWVEERSSGLSLSPLDLLCAELGAALGSGARAPTIRRIAMRVEKDEALRAVPSLLIHLGGYVGVPAVFESWNGIADMLARVPDARLHVEADLDARVQEGVRLYGRFDPARAEQQARRFATLGEDYYRNAMELSSVVLGSGELALREREIAAVAALAGLGGCEAQLRFHVGVALDNAVSVATLAGTLIVVQAIAGLPRANTAAGIAAEVLLDRDQSR